jgi:hypothetical protein
MSEHIVSRPELTAEYLRSVLHYDQETGIFTWKVSTAFAIKVGSVAGGPGHRGYLYIGIRKRLYAAHRLAWMYVHGAWPKGQIDHINRSSADNRITNLRDVSVKQNGHNRRTNSDNTSGHTGVTWRKQKSKWNAYIKHNYKRVNLGYFENLEDAVAARKAGELKYWGVNRAD